LLALIRSLTNEILILGRITFFSQTDSDDTEDFLVSLLSKLCLEMELKIGEIKKTKNYDILL